MVGSEALSNQKKSDERTGERGNSTFQHPTERALRANTTMIVIVIHLMFAINIGGPVPRDRYSE